MEPQKHRAKSLEEIEQEVHDLGLTHKTAAAIIRFANTLKQSRKLCASHIMLLTPGRRIHPPSPLSRHVWLQSEIEDDNGGPSTANEAAAGPSRHSEASSGSETTLVRSPKSPVGPETSPSRGFSWLVPVVSSGEDVHALGDVFLSSMDAAALTDIASRVGDLSLSGEYSFDEECSGMAAPFGASHQKDGSRWW